MRPYQVRNIPLKKSIHRRRSGVAAVYFALGLTAFLGVTAYAVDMGYLYMRKAEAQRAADAAALAGAWQLAHGKNKGAADTQATLYSSQNRYNPASTTSNVIVRTTYPVPERSNWYRVRVAREEPLFFARIFGLNKVWVGATATAQYKVYNDVPVPIAQYGQALTDATLEWNFSVFGSYALRSYGDNFSPKFLNDGKANPDYREPDNDAGEKNTRGGYDFRITAPTTMDKVQVELYDPDTYNINGQIDTSKNAVDEIRAGHAGRTSDYTKTEYALYWDNNTPFETADDVFISRASYGNDSSSDLKWVTPTGFLIDRKANNNRFATGDFRLNVVTVDGSSENGFNLRAGPPRTAAQAFNPNNGTSLSAQGKLPINFTKTGIARLGLGYVPKTAVTTGDGLLTVTRFDCDVEVKSLYYECDTLPQKFPINIKANNDGFDVDKIQLPADYKGGNWTAVYSAGAQDTSVWQVQYTGTGNPGSIRLVE